MAKPPPRIIVRIEITAGAKNSIEETCTRSGMTQVAAISRLVEWFSTQDQLTQAAIMGHYFMDDRPEVGLMVIERMAKGG